MSLPVKMTDDAKLLQEIRALLHQRDEVATVSQSELKSLREENDVLRAQVSVMKDAAHAKNLELEASVARISTLEKQVVEVDSLRFQVTALSTVQGQCAEQAERIKKLEAELAASETAVKTLRAEVAKAMTEHKNAVRIGNNNYDKCIEYKEQYEKMAGTYQAIVDRFSRGTVFLPGNNWKRALKYCGVYPDDHLIDYDDSVIDRYRKW